MSYTELQHLGNSYLIVDKNSKKCYIRTYFYYGLSKCNIIDEEVKDPSKYFTESDWEKMKFRYGL